MTYSRSIARQLVDLAAPIAGLNLLTMLALVIDTAMCGRLERAELALTALGFASQLVFLLLVAMMGLTVGTVAIVARAYGGADRERVDHVLRQSVMFTVLLGVTVGAVGNLFARELLGILGATEPVAELGLSYLRPLLWATPVYYLTMLLAGVLRGVGNTRLPFLVSLVANVLNVFLNYGFILGNMGFPALGLPGAAYGTIASQVFTVVTIIVLIRRGTVRDLHLPLAPTRLDWKLARQLFQIGGPAAADMVVLNAGFLTILGLLGRIDELAVAAHGIGLRLQALAFLPGLSVSQATAALVGQSLGAHDIDRAKRVTRVSVVLTTAVMTSLGLIIFLLEVPILASFDVDSTSELGRLSMLWLRLLGLGFPIVGAYVAFVGTLQGAGATKTSLRINIVATVAFQIPMSYLLGITFGLDEMGVWMAFPLSFVIKAGLGALAYRRGRWAKVGASPS